MSEVTESRGRWVIAIISGVIGALLGAGVSFYIFRQQLAFATKQMQVSLSRDLAKEFYQETTLYKEFRAAVESCKPLYKPWKGTFTHGQINQYLCFFDDLGFYHKQDALALEIIDHLFGAHVIEAFEYPEIRKYIALLRTSMDQPEAFKEFEKLAELIESDPKRQRQVQNARDACKGKG